jgi:hypothetical protein
MFLFLTNKLRFQRQVDRKISIPIPSHAHDSMILNLFMTISQTTVLTKFWSVHAKLLPVLISLSFRTSRRESERKAKQLIKQGRGGGGSSHGQLVICWTGEIGGRGIRRGEHLSNSASSENRRDHLILMVQKTII